MKKLILIAATILLFTLTACNNNNSDISDNGHSFVTPPLYEKYELKTGTQVNAIFIEFGCQTNNVTKIKASSQPPAQSIPQDKIKYIDGFEEDVLCWLDANAKTIYYYAHGVTDGGTKKIILSPDSSFLFYSCFYVTEIDLQYFDTRKVKNMSRMFYSCVKLESLDLSNFVTNKVTNMFYMFYYCEKLSSLDLSSFNTKEVTNMNFMFSGCNFLQTIYVSDSFDTSSVQDSSDMFSDCLSLKGGNNTTYDSGKTDKEYARIDAAGTPGYFTRKTNP